MSKEQPRTVELNVAERYALARTQPTKGDFITMTMTKNLITLLELSPAEAEQWGYKENGKGRWIAKSGEDISETLLADVTFSARQLDAISAALEKMNAGGELEVIHLRLYDLFVRQPARRAEDVLLEEADTVAAKADAAAVEG